MKKTIQIVPKKRNIMNFDNGYYQKSTLNNKNFNQREHFNANNGNNQQNNSHFNNNFLKRGNNSQQRQNQRFGTNKIVKN
jgi:hypothetical protein